MKKNQFNKDREEHGYWETYYTNGKLMYKGNWKDGNQDGYWECYFYSNRKLTKEFNI